MLRVYPLALTLFLAGCIGDIFAENPPVEVIYAPPTVEVESKCVVVEERKGRLSSQAAAQYISELKTALDTMCKGEKND